ncbi:vacuolar protein sorting-associated protein 22-like protein 1-like protein [Blastocladiella britannica]|nr:vacuolar protein sorting-associated protein 22-like protein 1-like protein [Blastocladiella britannica]
MRRNVGIAGLQRAQREREQFKDMGERMATEQLEQLKAQMSHFKSSLEHFAAQYRTDIAQNPAFRLKFQQMCASIGVDPLATSKGYWGQVLGINDFYYDLSVRILETCMAIRETVGPLVPLSILLGQLNRNRARRDGDQEDPGDEISEDDVRRSIQLLGPLGGGYELIAVAGTTVIQTVPRELNTDLLVVAQNLQAREIAAPADAPLFCGITATALAEGLGWSLERCQLCLELLVAEGMLWVDRPPSAGMHKPLPPAYFMVISSLFVH